LVSIELVILARLLGLEKFGLFSVVIAYVNILNSFVDFRVWEASIRYVGEFLEKKENDKTLSMIKFSFLVDVLTGIIAFVLSVLLAKIANDYFVKSENGVEFIIIYSISLLVSTANTTADALFRIFDKFKTIAFVNSSEALFRLALVSIVLILGYEIREVLFVYVLAAFFGFAIRQATVYRMLSGKNFNNWLLSPLKLLLPRLKEITWFLLNTSFNSTLKMANEGNIATLFLGHFFGNQEAGLYKVARSVIKGMAKIVDPVYEAIYPKLVSLSSQNLYEKSADIIKFALKSLLKFTLPVAAVILIFTEAIINLIFGSEYTQAANTMRILTLASLFSGSTFWVTPSLLALGRPGFRTAINLFKTIIFIVLLLIFVPTYSYVGAAVSYLLAEIINFFISIYLKKGLTKQI
ncbi:MAG: oligosaccharide flippase family protein, partial [Thermodesulfobacteriota bacterium]